MQVSTPGRVWKVGQLAAATGLTVRTLHHYDQIGLVSPSGRTAAEHRLYDEADVQRLYRVLALRQLGLPLDAVGSVMGGSTSMIEVLTAHQEYLEQQLAAIRRLRAQVATVATSMRDSPLASVEDFLDLIRKVVIVDETVKQYFSEAQLADLAERRERLGDQALRDVEEGWHDLLPRVAAAVESGMNPTAPEAQAMAQQWMALLERFHGGDAGLRDSLYTMQAENAEQIERDYGGPSSAQLEFIRRADAARG